MTMVCSELILHGEYIVLLKDATVLIAQLEDFLQQNIPFSTTILGGMSKDDNHC